jgi:hypothetical protein
MEKHPLFWNRLYRVDTAVSLGAAVVTLLSGFMEGIPWTFRIPAVLIAAAAALWVWRSLTLRRLVMPNAISSFYENDVIELHELFAGRSMIRDVVFKNVEIKGPGSICFEGNSKFDSEIYNPNLEVLMAVVNHQFYMTPHFQFRDCTFDKVMFTNCGILATPQFAEYLRQRSYGTVVPETPQTAKALTEEPMKEAEIKT